MTKINAIVLGVVDFFAALLPGFATVSLYLLLSNTKLDALTSQLGFAEASIAVVLVASYVVGQTLNAIGSFVLDPLYDVFYDPKGGLFAVSDNEQEEGWSATLSSVAEWRFPFSRFVTGLVEKGSPERATTIGAERDIAIGSKGHGAYQRVRAFLNLRCPVAFAEIERLEAEQKFLRTSSVATVVIAFVADMQGRSTWWIWGTAFFFFTRYVSRRRKTVERAYLYFSLRKVFPRFETGNETSSSALAGED